MVGADWGGVNWVVRAEWGGGELSGTQGVPGGTQGRLGGTQVWFNSTQRDVL